MNNDYPLKKNTVLIEEVINGSMGGQKKHPYFCPF
jgi:hypothetical protein